MSAPTPSEAQIDAALDATVCDGESVRFYLEAYAFANDDEVTCRIMTREVIATAIRAALPTLCAASSFQTRMDEWLLACFGETIARDKAERNHRFLEEALELVQALGCTASEAHQLVDYTFGRPSGEAFQEVGGVGTTLAALCLAHGFDMQAALEAELARIWTKVETIRAKQAAKPKHSPLPAAAPTPSEAVRVAVQELKRLVRHLSMEAHSSAETAALDIDAAALCIVEGIDALAALSLHVGDAADTDTGASALPTALSAPALRASAPIAGAGGESDRWIPVTERVPLEGQWVVCFLATRAADPLWVEDWPNVTSADGYMTHWLPLPELPDEGASSLVAPTTPTEGPAQTPDHVAQDLAAAHAQNSEAIARGWAGPAQTLTTLEELTAHPAGYRFICRKPGRVAEFVSIAPEGSEWWPWDAEKWHTVERVPLADAGPREVIWQAPELRATDRYPQGGDLSGLRGEAIEPGPQDAPESDSSKSAGTLTDPEGAS